MPIKCGIDLGTTYSAAAYVDEQGRSRIIKTLDGQTTIPSVVMIRGDQITVGEAALLQWIVDEEHVVRWIKRSMGDLNWMFPRRELFQFGISVDDDQEEESALAEARAEFAKHKVQLSDAAVLAIQPGRWAIRDGEACYLIRSEEDGVRAYEAMNAVDISAEVLREIKTYVEAGLGEAVDDAVITCPAYFNTIEIENTKAAGERAGFNVHEIIKEPVAAAVCDGVENIQEGEKLVVCDLGGGTYDATTLTFGNGKFQPLETMGDRRLGGHDWTTELMNLVSERFQDEFGTNPQDDLSARQTLYEECETAKRSFLKLTEVNIRCSCEGQMQQIPVTRDEFEDRTEYLIQPVVDWSEGALEKADLTWGDIDRILLVGGSSRLRRVSLALEEASGKKPILSKTPDLMVAQGAAMIAKGQVRVRRPSGALMEGAPGGLMEVSIGRTIARSLGTRVYDPDAEAVCNALMIPHGNEAPVSKSREDFEVTVDGQKDFDVQVVEFEDEENYEEICNYRCACLPNAKKGDRIRVTFDYDASAIVTARAEDVASGQSLEISKRSFREPGQDIGVRVKPMWVAFALDISYSMEGDKLQNAKQALVNNARDLIAQGGDACRVGVVTFSETAEIACRPTNELSKLESAIWPIEPVSTTAMDKGIELAMDLITSAPGEYDRVIVMLTDGMPDSDCEQKTLDVAETARNDGVKVCSLGIGSDDVDEDYLNSLTAGELTLVIDDLGEMSDGISTLLTKARSQGSITDRT